MRAMRTCHHRAPEPRMDSQGYALIASLITICG